MSEPGQAETQLYQVGCRYCS